MTVVLIISKAVLRRLIRLIVLIGVRICIGLVVLVWLIWLLISRLKGRLSAILTKTLIGPELLTAFSTLHFKITSLHTKLRSLLEIALRFAVDK